MCLMPASLSIYNHLLAFLDKQQNIGIVMSQSHLLDQKALSKSF